MKYNSQIQLFPLLRIAVSLIVGIVLGDFLFDAGVDMWWSLWLLVLWVVAAMAAGRFPMVQGPLILLASCSLGLVLAAQAKAELSMPLPDEEQLYKAVLTSEPVERGRVVRCDLLVTSGSLEGKRVKAAILRDTVGCLYKRLHVGDGILAASLFEEPRDLGSSHFHYSTYLNSHGYVATTFIYWSQWRKSVVDLSRLTRLERIRIRAMRFRQQLLQRYRNWGLGGQSLAVVAAMTLGDKSLLDPHTREAYSQSGASHVLALSGLHLGIIYMLFVMLTLGRRRRLLREVCIVAAIWGYVVMVGMAPSVVRAALMISIYSMVGLVQRDRMSLNTLSLTAIIMLLFRPLSLFDVGFQMSFMSVLSIMVLYEPLYHLFHPHFLFRHRLLGWLWSLVVVSVAAQAGVAPLVAYYFGRFSCLFLLTNFVVIPAATAVLYLVVPLFALTFWPAIQQFVASAMSWLVELQNSALEKISSIPGASIEDIHINRVQVLVLYLIIALLAGAFVRYSSSLARKRGV